jgi:general transcription factor 3C polypeptide 5 (transcription factor C subunit 1)
VTEPGAKLTTARAPSIRLGKHNMAKGAIPPEDLAAARLQATLQRNLNAKRRQKQQDVHV